MSLDDQTINYDLLDFNSDPTICAYLLTCVSGGAPTLQQVGCVLIAPRICYVRASKSKLSFCRPIFTRLFRHKPACELLFFGVGSAGCFVVALMNWKEQQWMRLHLPLQPSNPAAPCRSRQLLCWRK